MEFTNDIIRVYIDKAHGLAREMSRCRSRKVGVVLFSDFGSINEKVVYGFNGMHRDGTDKSCLEGDCPRCLNRAFSTPAGSDLDQCLCVHAEVEALANAALFRMNLASPTVLFSTDRPCNSCTKLLATFCIDVVYFDRHYPGATISYADMRIIQMV